MRKCAITADKTLPALEAAHIKDFSEEGPNQINNGLLLRSDLHKLFDVLREVVSSHPKVLSGPDLPIEERPDAEISGFEDSGVKILIEFWMEGIDDGEHRVGGDLYLMIWDALKENNVQIPFPQREVKIINVGKDIGSI